MDSRELGALNINQELQKQQEIHVNMDQQQEEVKRNVLQPEQEKQQIEGTHQIVGTDPLHAAAKRRCKSIKPRGLPLQHLLAV